jgi:hypothetical protein
LAHAHPKSLQKPLRGNSSPELVCAVTSVESSATRLHAPTAFEARHDSHTPLTFAYCDRLAPSVLIYGLSRYSLRRAIFALSWFAIHVLSTSLSASSVSSKPRLCAEPTSCLGSYRQFTWQRTAIPNLPQNPFVDYSWSIRIHSHHNPPHTCHVLVSHPFHRKFRIHTTY